MLFLIKIIINDVVHSKIGNIIFKLNASTRISSGTQNRERPFSIIYSTGIKSKWTLFGEFSYAS
jgi:hypothetical protein